MTDPTAIERYRIPDLLRKPAEEALDAPLQAGWPARLWGGDRMGEGALPGGALGSTAPEAVRRATEAFEPSTTLYLIASKSGTTTETLAFLEHFWALERAGHHEIGSRDEGEHFAATGDPGPALEAVPHSDEFRAVFLNPPDIGGRYSALSYVGLVPGALLDLDLEALLADGRRGAQGRRAEDAGNPGLALGTALGALALEGRDKLTFVLDPGLAGFGAW